MSDQINFNTIYTIICLIFSCGTAYATIKVSIKSILKDMQLLNQQMEDARRRLEAHEAEMAAWRTEREVSRIRFEQLQEKMTEVSTGLRGVTDTLHKLEKRGNLQWRENVNPST